MWLTLSLLVLVIVANNQLKLFDHNEQLLNLSQQPNFEAGFKDWLSELGVNTQNTVVHFSNDTCWCQFVATPHINSVFKLASAYNKTNITLNMTNLSLSTPYVPSTPAVAVFDTQGMLTYLGPYSTGTFCSAGNGLVEPFVAHTQISTYPTILLDAQGCYCKTT